MDDMIDVAFSKPSGALYYDISLNNEGDLTGVSGFDTAILMSFLCERRADISEVEAPQYRRGWWGNTLSLVPGFEMGSKNWLLYQARLTTDAANRAITYNQDAFQWFVQDGYLDRVDVSSNITNSGLIININLIRGNDVVNSLAFVLWNNTVTQLN